MEWVIIILVILGIIGATNDSAEKKKKKEEAERQQQAAEDYIMKSGDEEAIKQLMLMKANPSSYQSQFKEAAGGNSIMRTAFGVFTGFIAADIVTSAIHQHQLEEALANFEAELESVGGLDNFSLEDGPLTGDFEMAEADIDTGDDGDWDIFS
jgi:hypothetical protein